MPIRPPSSKDMAMLNPAFSSPNLFDAGTKRSSIIISAVWERFRPILISGGPAVKPGRPFSTKKAVIPLRPKLRSTVAKTVNRSASPPPVMNNLLPFSKYPPSNAVAVVTSAAASEPAPVSVRAKAPSSLPLARAGKNLFFCSSEP